MGFKEKVTPKFKLGDIVFLQAHAKKDSKCFLLCRGVVNRLPTQNSPVYKVVVIEVCKTTIGKIKTELGKDLLGLKIPCNEEQMFFIPSDFIKLAYDWNNGKESWESLDYPKIAKIIKNIKER